MKNQNTFLGLKLEWIDRAYTLTSVILATTLFIVMYDAKRISKKEVDKLK